MLALAASTQAPTLDEPAHLAAGVCHWRCGAVDVYRVNPPLPRAIAALPLLFMEVRTDWTRYTRGAHSRAEFDVGEDFLRANGVRSSRLFSIARLALIPLSLLGSAVCYRWAADLYGRAAGFAALALWCMHPDTLACGAIITGDSAAAALGLAANYAFWRWARSPCWPRALNAGLWLGLAELTKSTWLVLFPLWPALWCLTAMRDTSAKSAVRPARAALCGPAQLLAILLLGLFVLNSGYRFVGSGRPLRSYRFVSELLGGAGSEATAPGNRFADSCLGFVPVPMPADYALGVDLQRRDFEDGKLSYLRGQWRPHGWWYWYLYALGVKVPLGTLAFVAVALIARFLRRESKAAWRDEIILVAPLFAVLILVSSQTGFSRYVRYALPAVPYGLIWASSLARLAIVGRRATMALVAVLITWSVGSSFWYFPHSMSYFNELAGGPTGGPEHLVDGNVDWGQDLLFLKQWYDAHPEARPLRLAYFGALDPRAVGIEFSLPRAFPDASENRALAAHIPATLTPGWYAVSVNCLYGFPCSVADGRGGRQFLGRAYYSYFRRFEPASMAGYSIYIYHLSTDDIAKALRQAR